MHTHNNTSTLLLMSLAHRQHPVARNEHVYLATILKMCVQTKPLPSWRQARRSGHYRPNPAVPSRLQAVGPWPQACAGPTGRRRHLQGAGSGPVGRMPS
jgi:hypothetical protein